LLIHCGHEACKLSEGGVLWSEWVMHLLPRYATFWSFTDKVC